MGRKVVLKVGDTLNGLTVLERLPPSYSGAALVHWVRCRCNACGREDYKCRTFHVRRNKTGSCGCLFDSAAHGKKLRLFNAISEEVLPKHFWSGARSRHIATGYNESSLISRDYLHDLWRKQDGKCAITGTPLELYVVNKQIEHRGDKHPYYPLSADVENPASVDRKDSRFGYVGGNVQWVHADINTMKFDFQPEYFLRMCRTVVRHQASLEWGDPHKIEEFDPEIMPTRARGNKENDVDKPQPLYKFKFVYAEETDEHKS